MNAEPGSIRARDLGFRHAGAARPALSDVSFDVEPGRTLLVVGPSGSGKSTLALAIAGLVPRGSTSNDTSDSAGRAAPA